MLALTACATARPAPDTQVASVARGSVSLPDVAAGQGGRLVVWWEGADERKQRGGLDFTLFAELLDRYQVLPLEAEARDVPFTLPGAPSGPLHIYAVLDTNGTFWSTVLGGGAGNFRGRSAAADAHGAVTVTLELIPAREQREYCDGARFRLLHLDAPYVAGTVGNKTRRRLCAFVPPSYASDPDRRYPVVYLLPGLASTDSARMAGSNSVRALADTLGTEAILVGVDTSTVTGSTYFTDSAASGAWMRFVDEMVAAVDGSLRTHASADGRGLVGQSTGGYNAISLAMRRPDLFSTAGASASDGLDLSVWLLAPGAAEPTIRPRWLTWMRLEAALALPHGRQAGQFISYAADWSPKSASTGVPFEWPADLTSGRVLPEVWSKWWSQCPAALLDDPIASARARDTLNDRLFIAVGRHDEFDLHPPAVAFSDKLRAAGIRHTLVVGDGAHGRGQRERLRQAFEYVVSRLIR